MLSCQISHNSSDNNSQDNSEKTTEEQQSSGMQSFSTTVENFADTVARLTDDSIIVLTGEVTEENIRTIRKIIDHSGNDIYLDLSKTTGLLRIPSRAFEVCPNLLGINIPSSVTSIGERAFCSSTISQVIIPSSVTSIGDNAFSQCFELTQISIPTSVTSIEYEAFHYCINLTSVEFEQTANWYTTDDEDNFQNKTGGTPIDVTNSTTNATNIKSTYANYFWYRTDN